MTKVLFIITSHDTLGATDRKTGYYIPELAHPYNALVEKGIEVVLASPKGGVPPVDPNSEIQFKDDPEVLKFKQDSAAIAKLNSTIPLSQVNPADYAAVFYPGGHGPMFDLATDETSMSICAKIYEAGGVVGALCHGPAGIVNVKLSNNEYLVKDKNVGGFSNSEEEAAQLTKVMPFLLETKLIEHGAKYSKAENWAEHVVVDGRIVTGQNPRSGSLAGKKLAELVLAMV